MKFSVVTISFNQASFLDRAILSVLSQRNKTVDVEYIVVDAGSRDGSREIIERYRDRLARVIFEQDKGPADGLNKGFAHATGDILCFLNSDDVFLPGAFEKARRWLELNPTVDVAAGHGYTIDENDAVLHKVYSRSFSIEAYLSGSTVIVQQSTFFRAGAFEKTAGFNTLNHTCWDGELWVDMALAGARFAVVNSFWSGFRIHGASITGSNAYNGTLSRVYEEDHARIRSRLGFQQPSQWKRKYLWAASWFRNPVGLISRVGDGLAHPSRVI